MSRGRLCGRTTAARSYASHIRLHLEPHLGHILLRTCAPTTWIRCMRLCSATRQPPQKAATVRHIHATLRAALNVAVRRRLIPWNPAVHIELPSTDRTQT